MSIGQGMTQELQHESQSTRAMLALVPFDRADFRPHEKSMEMLPLVSHIVDSIGWVPTICQMDVFVLNREEWTPYKATNPAELVAQFDENIEAACKAIAATPDEKMFVTWTMESDGKTMIKMPRIAVLRGFVLSHLVHHRAQLGVYLRMLDIALPQVYGPTADNPGMMA
ncbi:MAG: hypothetical protein PWP23_2191 [Candidatus Sumerlaeota bacterium]|nr:hypothetical protein [Candidatus Sumerlaeota bacterium]